MRIRVVSTLAACLLLSTAAPPAAADLVFVGWREGSWSLFRQVEPATAPEILRHDLAFDASAPALSPDGLRVAFEVPGQGILVCPLDAAGRCETLRTEIGWPARPTWNPATGELLFVRYVADAAGEDSDLLIASPDLTKVRPLVAQTGNQDSPDVSADGRLLVYDSAQVLTLHRGGVQVVRHLWALDLETGRARPLVPGAAQDMQPDLSPDGRWVAFSSDRGDEGFEIWVVGIDGQGLRQVTAGEGVGTWPAWSPDGTTILYTRAREGRFELWTTPADGSATRPFEPFGGGSDVQLRDPDWR
jgi:Tol biopolymer transport system component